MIKSPRIFFAALGLLLAGSLQAQTPIRYDSQPGSKLTIEGTSSIHDWTVETRLIGGFMELDPAFDADLKTLKSTPKVEVTLPVRQLKSTDNKPSMDKVMYEHMNVKDNPLVKYRLLALTPKATPGPGSQFEAKGELTVSGVTRTNTMPISFERLDKTKIKVKGNTSVKMTDFGIKPPAPAIGLGLIKTGDDVKLSFEWTTAQPDKAAESK